MPLLCYLKAKIYTIRCRYDDSLIYVGSTIGRLTDRFSVHKRDINCSLYKYIQTNCNGDWSDWYIELYEYCPCYNKEELNKNEWIIIREIATIYKNIAGRTKGEWYADNKEVHCLNVQQNYINNKDKRLLQMKQYNDKNKEKIAEYQKQYKKFYRTKI